MTDTRPLILLTGASGYIGGRLLRVLEEKGGRVRCIARRPEYLKSRVGPGTEVVPGDLLDPPSLERALEGVHTAYYLVHSMASSGNFEEKDRLAAGNFASAARSVRWNNVMWRFSFFRPTSRGPWLVSLRRRGGRAAAGCAAELRRDAPFLRDD